MKSRVYLKHVVIQLLRKPVLYSNSPPDFFKLNLFDNFGNSKVFRTFLM